MLSYSIIERHFNIGPIHGTVGASPLTQPSLFLLNIIVYRTYILLRVYVLFEQVHYCLQKMRYCFPPLSVFFYIKNVRFHLLKNISFLLKYYVYFSKNVLKKLVDILADNSVEVLYIVQLITVNNIATW